MDASQIVTVPLVHKDHTGSETDDNVFLFEDDVHESEIGHFVNEISYDGTRQDRKPRNNTFATDFAGTLNGYSHRDIKLDKFCFICVNKLLLQVLLKELEEFAFKGIPDVRGCKVQDAQMLEEIVSITVSSAKSKSLN